VTEKYLSFGKFTLFRRLAKGGMAEIYLARMREMAGIERMVVVKLIATRFGEDVSFREMFQDEARIAATLTHPNIGHVFEVGKTNGIYYLAMEFIHGRDLRTIVRQSIKRYRRALPPDIAVNIATKVCSALHYAHEAADLEGRPLNIIHRDVSPSNVMVTFGGNVKLVDFGIAKAANRISLTMPGFIKGKVRYLSPEQTMGKPIDHRSDVFTLGTTLWETTVGRHLFAGKQDIEIYEAIANARIRPPGKYVEDYPAQLEKILNKALTKEPDDRYPNAQAFQMDLERFAQKSSFTLSDIQLSRYMTELFADEIGGWEKAKAEGRSLLDFLIETGDDIDPALVAHLGAAERATTGPNPQAAAPRSAGGEMRSKTVTDTLRPESKQPERSTVIVGETHSAEELAAMGAGSGGPIKPSGSATGPITMGQQQGNRGKKKPTSDIAARKSRPPTDSAGSESITKPNLEAASGNLEKISTSDTMLPSSLSPNGEAGNERPTMLAEPQDLGPESHLPRDIPLGPGTMVVAAEDITEPIDPAGVYPTVTPGAEDRLSRSARHTGGRRRLQGRRADGSPESGDQLRDGFAHEKPTVVLDGDDPTGQAGKKKEKTGDWGHKRATPDEPRPGTHPYFKGEGKTVIPQIEGEHSEGSNWLIAFVVGLIVACIVGAGAYYLLSRKNTAAPAPTTTISSKAVVPAKKNTTPPSTKKKPVPETKVAVQLLRLTSMPSGARVFSSSDGTQLGETPLSLAAENQKVELHLKGHEVMTIVLDPALKSQLVTLKVLPKAPPVRKAARVRTPPSRSKPSRGTKPSGTPRTTKTTTKKPRPTKKAPAKDDNGIIDPFAQ
jgi:serine/threonine protein kinase